MKIKLNDKDYEFSFWTGMKFYIIYKIVFSVILFSITLVLATIIGLVSNFI